MLSNVRFSIISTTRWSNCEKSGAAWVAGGGLPRPPPEHAAAAARPALAMRNSRLVQDARATYSLMCTPSYGASGQPSRNTPRVDDSQRPRRTARRSCRRLTPLETTAAVATTVAVLATGRPMTPRRAMRAGRSGISGSFTFVGFFRLDGGEDGLDGDSPVGD